jgi:hypothetical protein
LNATVSKEQVSLVRINYIVGGPQNLHRGGMGKFLYDQDALRQKVRPSLGKPVIQDPDSGQTSRVLIRPLSATWSARGSMPESLNPPSGTTTPNEKALPVSR